ncbi:hypothetical protein AQUCO_00100558v1 [Aquilegia coerulea]|uniref:Uncharacterized protein n=1 Tax=Aquilegia coerulea TaxID=218851 RepID=A0A2G5FAW6_AQUCA|nr:hypothetical protein AQUCO_00100558v1 [Aquilegia coerulea]
MVKGGAVLNKDGVSGTVYFTPRKRWPNYSDWDSLVSKLGFMVFTSMPLATQQTGACQQDHTIILPEKSMVRLRMKSVMHAGDLENVTIGDDGWYLWFSLCNA